MGTRADFYVRKNGQMTWLGSRGWDGYPGGIDKSVLEAKTQKAFKGNVKVFLKAHKDSTFPREGWPWPWKDSSTTDYAYIYENGKVMASCFGRELFDPLKGRDEKESSQEIKDYFPDMTKRQNVQWGEKSGLIMITTRGVVMILLVLMMSFAAQAQCKKIHIQQVDLVELGNCQYRATIHGWQNSGNPSIKPFYSCNGTLTALDCIDLLQDSVHQTTTFTCDCIYMPEIIIIGYASENCKGDTCVAYGGGGNMALKPQQKKIKELDPGITWNGREFRGVEEHSVKIYSVTGVLLFQSIWESTARPQLQTGVYYAVLRTKYGSPKTTIIFHK